jgi:hypothetical protein
MGTSRKITERQLTLAKDAAEARKKVLEGKGITGDAVANDPQWRNLDAKFRQIIARLKAISTVEGVAADLEKRKAERLAAEAAEKAERKSGKKAEKKPAKAEAKPAKKKEGGGGGGKDKPPAKPKKEAGEKAEKK